jgi:hypothetical protein
LILLLVGPGRKVGPFSFKKCLQDEVGSDDKVVGKEAKLNYSIPPVKILAFGRDYFHHR